MSYPSEYAHPNLPRFSCTFEMLLLIIGFFLRPGVELFIMGYPDIIQVIRPWISIESHGDLGYPHDLGNLHD